MMWRAKEPAPSIADVASSITPPGELAHTERRLANLLSRQGELSEQRSAAMGTGLLDPALKFTGNHAPEDESKMRAIVARLNSELSEVGEQISTLRQRQAMLRASYRRDVAMLLAGRRNDALAVAEDARARLIEALGEIDEIDARSSGRPLRVAEDRRLLETVLNAALRRRAGVDDAA